MTYWSHVQDPLTMGHVTQPSRLGKDLQRRKKVIKFYNISRGKADKEGGQGVFRRGGIWSKDKALALNTVLKGPQCLECRVIKYCRGDKENGSL